MYVLRMNKRSLSEKLKEAAFSGDAAQVLLLLEAGADVDEMGRNWNPLHAAIEEDHLEVVRILLAAGANPDFQIDGFSALHHAIDVQMDGYQQMRETQLPSVNMVKALIEAGANANVTYKNKTPLQLAEWYGHTAATAYLLSLKDET